MIRMSIVVLALAALAVVGCGDKGTKKGKTEKKAEETRAKKTAEPEPVKVPRVEVLPDPSRDQARRAQEATVDSEKIGAEAPPTGKKIGAPSGKPLPQEPTDPSRDQARRVEEATVAPADPGSPTANLAPLDLSVADSTVKVIIMAPGGAAARDDYGAVEIAKEPDFQMEFSEEEAVDFLARKKEIEANGINKLKKYHVDTADTLVYETEIMGKPEFHFIATVKVGEILYLCEDQKGPVFSQAAVSAMLAACRSARLKEHALPMPALDGKPGPAMPAIDLD